MKANLALVLLVAVAGCAGRYRVNEVSDTVPNLFLEEVRAGSGSTKLVFRYEADEAVSIGVHPPGHPQAFVLRTVDGLQTLALTDVSGIAELPETTEVGPRDSLRFSLTFEALPGGTNAFSAGPAVFDPERPGESWQFFRIALDGANVVTCW